MTDIVDYLMMRRADGALFNPSGPTAADTIATLRAEVERLTGERDRQYEENVSLIAENQKLRAALEEIEQVALSYVNMKYAKLARAALAEEKKDDL